MKKYTSDEIEIFYNEDSFEIATDGDISLMAYKAGFEKAMNLCQIEINNLPIKIKPGLTNIKIYIENGSIIVEPNMTSENLDI